MSNDKQDKTVLPYELEPDEGALRQASQRPRAVEKKSGRGSSRDTLTNIFTGFNHRMAPLYVPKNVDNVGFTFFTRPDCNFNLANMSSSRKLLEVQRAGRGSQSAAIIGMLDPLNEWLALDKKTRYLGGPFAREVQFDNRCAFIPMLSNLLTSLTGFPDSTLDVWTSEEGLIREQVTYADSIYEVNNAFTLSAQFRNIDGDPITTYLNFMIDYISNVRRGTYVPRAENMFQRVVDYQSRVYRFVMDPTKRYIRKFGIANAVFPVTDGMGAAMNVSGNNPIITDTDQISVQYQAVGAYYSDPIIIQEFNDVVCIFNPDMLPISESTSEFIPHGKNYMRKLSREEIGIFNYQGYPRINPNTYELDWWIYGDTYETILSEVKNV